MRCKLLVLAIGAAAVAAPSAHDAHADPCGMVPPLIVPQGEIAIKRVGAQKTFVSHVRGVETMVLRPGFKGKVDEFGMLIPFPNPPAIRKVDDDIFAHIAAAVEPPEVVAHVWNRRRMRRSVPASRGAGKASADESAGEDGLSFNTVRVVNREAVGMYDVAVLEAGSSVALKRWMDDNGFRYPNGMDRVTQEYVDAGWFFVAVKTQVGQKDGVNPRPGMRKANAKLPAGADFNGHVQAMGFRFKTKELVVPMRLSAFNAGELRNIVYVLTDQPSRIERLPKRFVVRQISGRELYRNLTGPLPLRIFGGTFKDLNQWQRTNLKTQRKSDRFNGLAKDMFAGDMLAVRLGRLANPVEEKEKELLAIGESLGLRGKNIDNLHRAELAKMQGAAERTALRGIRNLHMTVIDGTFEREVLADDNLTFARYRMPGHRNNVESYDATRAAPGGKRGGILYRASVDFLETQMGPNADRAASLDDDAPRPWWVGGGIGLGVVVMLGGFVFGRRRSAALLAALIAAGITLPAVSAGAQSAGRSALIAQLENPKEARGAAAQLARMGDRAVDDLVDYVVDSTNLSARGWAIVALGEIGGHRVDAALTALHTQSAQPMLVRTWAAAARLEIARGADELLALAPLAGQFPALGRPLGRRLVAELGSKRGANRAAVMLEAVTRVPSIAAAIQAEMLKLPSRDLVSAMISGKDNNIRRMAASYVATVAQTRKDIPRSVVRALRFDARADAPPWGTSMALFIPGLTWDKANARALVEQLLRWHLWADINSQPNIQNQIHNNLRSVALVRVAGYRNPGWNPIGTVEWLRIWRDAAGDAAVRKILREQKALDRYRNL